MISVETQGRVAVVQMYHGKANALDTTLCREFTGVFASARASLWCSSVGHIPALRPVISVTGETLPV